MNRVYSCTRQQSDSGGSILCGTTAAAPFRFWGCGGICAMDVGGRRRGWRRAARGGGRRPAPGKEEGGVWWREESGAGEGGADRKSVV